MNVWQSLAISQSGMDVEQLRAEIAARNIAHANVATAPGALPFKPLKLMTQSVASQTFDSVLSQAGGVSGYVVEMGNQARRVQDPANPLADAQGFVHYPGVDTVSEMFALTMAVRSYEANVTAFNAARTMAVKALEIGGRG